MFEPYAREAAFAVEAVASAGRLCARIQAHMVTPALAKSDRSPVTVADYASQAVVSRMLAEAFPDDVIVAEEDSGALQEPENAGTLEAVVRYTRSIFDGADTEDVCRWIDRGVAEPAERFWTLDPIDGTKGFLRGGQYVVALALIESGRVVLGALSCPHMNDDLKTGVPGGCEVVAVRGEGAWRVDDGGAPIERLEVSSLRDASQARVLRSFEAAHTDVGMIDRLTQTLGIAEPPVRMDSQAKYVLLAAGKGDLLFRLLSPQRPDYREKIWDQAAGSILVEEAGGRVTDLRGERLDFSCGRELTANRGVLASNGHLHEAALHALREVGA